MKAPAGPWLGWGAARLAFGAACLSLASFASTAESLKEVAAYGYTLGWERIVNGSVSAASSLSLTGLTATYRAYMLVFDDLLPATDNAELMLRTDTNNGASFEAGASDYAHGRQVIVIGTGINVGSNGATRITIATNLGNVDGEEAGGSIMIMNPMGTGGHTTVTWSVSYRDNDARVRHVSVQGSGRRLAAEANNAIQIIMSTGNISTMNYTLYGLRGG